MSDVTVSSVGHELVKAAPPLVVATTTFLGFTLQEWVYIVTITYTLLQISLLLWPFIKGGIKNVKDK
jgi:hypothetical protein